MHYFSKKRFFVFLLVLIVMCSSFVFGYDGESTPDGEDEPNQEEYLLGEGWASNIIPSEQVDAVWVALCRSLERPDGFEKCGKYVVADGSSNGISTTFSLDWFNSNEDIYDLFDLSSNEKKNKLIHAISFRLTQHPFKLSSSENLFISSHGNPKGEYSEDTVLDSIKSFYETELNGGQFFNWDLFEANAPHAGEDNAMVYVDILNRENCTDLADYNQQFCEGVDLVDPNVGIEVSGHGNPGLGGCNPSEWLKKEDPNYRNYGRDWSDDKKSDSFKKDNPIVSDCCGNDPEDIGALKSGGDDPTENQILCLKESFNSEGDSVTGDHYVWLTASDTDVAFNIRTINKSYEGKDYIYDTLAYGGTKGNWFICDTGFDNGNLDEFYEFSTPDSDDSWKEGSGPLIKEYEFLPKITGGPSFGITTGLGGDAELGVSNVGTGLDGDLDGKSATALKDIDDFGHDGSVVGTASATPCDRDGDGYDGRYTANDKLAQDSALIEGAIPFIYDSQCPSPIPKGGYDCNDTNPFMNPGNVDWCGDGIDNDCDGSVDLEGAGCQNIHANLSSGNFTDAMLIPRFMCINEDDKGSFVECGGIDLTDSKNGFPTGRRVGSAVKTIFEFVKWSDSPACGNRSNCVLEYKAKSPHADSADLINNPPYFLIFPKNQWDVEISDWSDYEFLEFYIWFDANFVQDIFIGELIDPNSEFKLGNYKRLFQDSIVKYVVNEPQLRKWLHVRIPLDLISDKSKIDAFALLSYPVDIAASGNLFKSNGIDYSNRIGIDKFYLKQNKVNNYFCTGTFPTSTWIDDLDEKDTKDPNLFGPYPQGKVACDSMPGFKWTGTQCCGDDTGQDTNTTKFGEMTDKETYVDVEGACFNGKPVLPNSSFTIIKFGIEESVEYNGNFTNLCTNQTCNYYIPPDLGLKITNPHSDSYSLSVYGDTPPPHLVGNKSYTREPYSSLQAEGIKSKPLPFKIQYTNQNFHTCNAEPYFFDLTSSLSKTSDDVEIIIKENNHISNKTEPTCEVLGEYFCDINSGWSHDGLYNYSSNGMLAVPPSHRNITKNVINLISNPSFEE